MIALTSLLVIALSVPSQEQNAPILAYPHLFAQARTSPRQWHGIVSLSMFNNLHTNVIIDNTEVRAGDAPIIQHGSDLDDRLTIQYNPSSKPPKLQVIKLNGIEIYNVNTQPPLINNVNTQPAVPQRLPEVAEQNSCEQDTWNNQPMATEYSSTSDDQYAGHSSIYQLQDSKLLFVCSATLVSRQHVVTAAHCITVKGTAEIVDISTILVYLGKHDQGVADTKTRISRGMKVNEIVVHPQYVPLLYKEDVSILRLQDPVSITDRIRPVCLWPENEVDLNKFVGKTGLVVGREFDNRGVSSCMTEMPVVNREVCIKSKPWYFGKYLAPSSYCGYTDDPGCGGSPAGTGSGMIFNVQNLWYLRGFVSFTVSQLDDTWEEASHYVVFTDLAQFVPWIKEYMRGSG